MNILIVLGHPDMGSFDAALAFAYAEGAKDAGAAVEVLELGKLQFDPILHKGYHEIQQLEPDLIKSQELIKWANHLVFVYPSWWGNMPALLKGFIDRVFLPGFAFKYRENSPFWDKFLGGRSARIILTMDSPGLWNRLVYHRANIYAMKAATLEFCGIKPVKVSVFDRIRFSTEQKRNEWINKAYELGSSLL